MIYFIRHGQTDWNLSRLMQGRTDIPLNAQGRIEAKKTAEALKDVTFDKVFCSPLSRALETCKAVVGKFPITVDARLIERNFGEYEGKSLQIMIDEGFWKETGTQTINGGESLSRVISRVYSFLDEITEKYSEKNVLIVAHGGIGMVVKSYFLGKPEDGDYFNYIVRNCEVLTFPN